MRPVILGVLQGAAHESRALASGRPSSLKATAPASASSAISVSCSPLRPRVTAA